MTRSLCLRSKYNLCDDCIFTKLIKEKNKPRRLFSKVLIYNTSSCYITLRRKCTAGSHGLNHGPTKLPMSMSLPPVPRNKTLFGNRAFAEVIS